MIIFVYGSNEAGRHGAGAAKHAHMYWGAQYFKGWGLGREQTGGLNSFGIPTKDRDLKPLPLDAIRSYVERFKGYALLHPMDLFLVTRVGCGRAGYTNEDIAPMFVGASANCWFDPAWLPWGLPTWKEEPNEVAMSARKSARQASKGPSGPA